jgi:hypothetical protein
MIKMIRLLAVLYIASFIPMTILAQTHPMDSLKKYSYYVFGNQPTPDGKSMQTVEGGCFFVKADSGIFLVSAKHLFTSWSTADAEKPVLYPDTLFVRLTAADGNGFVDFPIDIRKIKAQVQGSFYYNEADIFVLPFPDTGRFTINAISLAEIEPVSADTKTSSIVYGFPKTNPYHLEGRVFSSPGENITYRDNKRNVDVNDKINYLIECEGVVQGGYSGAPVFLKKDGSETWYFGGIVSQGVPGDNYFFVVKPVFLLQAIESYFF